MGSGIFLQVREALDAVLFHLDLGAGQHVDGVDQDVFALELILEVEVHVVQHVLDVQALGAQQEGVAVSGLFVGEGSAGHAAAAGLVAHVNGHAQLVLQQSSHGTDGAVSAAAQAPGANDGDAALKLPILGGSHGADAHDHDQGQKQSNDFFHGKIPPENISQADAPWRHRSARLPKCKRKIRKKNEIEKTGLF